MSNKVKLIITLVLCLVVATAIIFNEVLWSMLLGAVLLAKNSLFKVLMVLKKFFFKEGVVSFATIAWKKVIISSTLALSKRAIINTITGFFQERVIKPLIHPLTRYLRVRWNLFKASSLWKKAYTVLFGSIPATAMLSAIGIWDALALLLKSFSLAKFLTIILKLIMTCFVFFQNIWRSWIQPYLDFIIVTIFVTYMEKLPFIGALIRRIRITLKWRWRHFKRRKDRIIDQHVDQKVNLFGERIHQHVNKKKDQVAQMVQQGVPVSVAVEAVKVDADNEPAKEKTDTPLEESVVETPKLADLEDSLAEEQLEKVEEDAEKVGRVIHKIDGPVKSEKD